MAVSSIRVTEGTGPYLHTWQRSISSANREDQYVQLGEPALSTFVFSGSASVATTDAHIIQIMSGSATYTRIERIEIAPNDLPAAASNLQIAVQRLTTAGTTGTTATPYPLDTADSVNATGLILPSSKGTQGAWLWTIDVPMGTAFTTGAAPRIWEAGPRMKPLIIPSGTANGICLRVVTGIASAAVSFTIFGTETAWL